MLSLVAALALSGAPGPQLKSLQGLNVQALKPWLVANLPSLAKCTPASAKDEVVSVKGEFSSGPDLRVVKVEASASDVRCVKEVVEGWKNDGHQPRGGPVSFSYFVK